MENDWAWWELKGAPDLDVRQRGSMADLCERLAAQPGLSFSAAAGTAGRQAFGRLGTWAGATGEVEALGAAASPSESGSGLGADALLAGHRQQTAQRSTAYPLVLVAQDTTEFQFPASTIPTGEAGLGPTSRAAASRGLLSHSALALSPQGLPLGLVHLALWARDPASHGQRSLRRQRELADKESHKWLEGVTAVEACFPAEQPVLVIQDREGDVFGLLAQTRRPQTFLLLRAAQNRKVQWLTPAGERTTALLFAAAAASPVVGEVTVHLPRRRDPEDTAATLELRVTQLEVQVPRHARAGTVRVAQTVTVVRARELTPPPGEAAIEWVLVTTLPVETPAQAAEVVGYYACRWRIERLHYVLKSGLQVEAGQYETRATLERALALYYLVAWRLLWLTYLGRVAPERAAEAVLTAAELQVLRHATRRSVHTVGEAILALGVLGGYTPYRRALPPGAKVLWRGYQRLQAALLGYRARQEE